MRGGGRGRLNQTWVMFLTEIPGTRGDFKNKSKTLSKNVRSNGRLVKKVSLQSSLAKMTNL